MASLSSFRCPTIRCLTSKNDGEPNKKLADLSADQKTNEAAAARSVCTAQNLRIANHENRRSIPTKKQLVDAFRQGVIIEEEVCYRQTIVIRSFEVDPHENATVESILNLLQETALNHAWMTGHFCGGSGATHGMIRNNLIWVVSRMHVQLDCYPIWGEVIDIDTWVGASGKNGMRREWLLKSHSTGQIYARATSKWVMMNQQTRRLSKIPEEVMRAEISPWFCQKHALEEDAPEKIGKLDQNAKHIFSGLKPRWSDLDMNQHVNNVKYARWMLETIPDEFMRSHQLSEIIMEYKRECGSSDVVQSLCEPHDGGVFDNEVQHSNSRKQPNGFSMPSPIIDGNGQMHSFYQGPYSCYTHLLQTDGESKNEEIARGRTKWKTKEQSATRC